MKTSYAMTVVVILMLCGAGTVSAQSSAPEPTTREVRDKKIRENCLAALRTNNDGVIEAVLLVVMDVKIRFPEFFLGDIQKVIDSLAAASPSSSIRYKAILAAQVCESPESFSCCRNISLEDRGSSYRMIAERVQQRLF